MNIPCYKLKIDLSTAFADGFLDRVINKNSYHFAVKIDDPLFFNQEWVDIVHNEYRLPFTVAEIFYRSGSDPMVVHMDSTRDPNKLPIAAFNIVIYGGKNSSMVWYDMPNELPILDRDVNAYWRWDEAVRFTETYRDNLLDFSMVRVDWPHAVENAEERICVSFRVPRDFFNSWNQAVEYIKPYIK